MQRTTTPDHTTPEAKNDTPRALTIFLPPGERARALRALRRLHPKRDEAFRIALGLRAQRKGQRSDARG